MSFLTRTAIRSTRSVALTPRAFSTSLATRKTATEAVKDTVKTVDRKVSDKIVGGIEIGRKCLPQLNTIHSYPASTHQYRIPCMATDTSSPETATRKAKSAVGIGSEDAKAKASQFTEYAKGKAHETAGEAKGKAHEVTGEAKGKINETKGKL